MIRIVVTVVGLICLVRGSVLPSDGERIVGGYDTDIATHPYQVSLQYKGSHFCGGSLITQLYVVTAAHCVAAVASVNKNTLQVRLGSTVWNSGGILKNVTKLVKHASYSATTMVYDVGLVKLSSAVSFTDSIQKIALATKDPAFGAIGYISGWGTLHSGDTTLPTTLQAAEVQFIPRQNCSGTGYNYGKSITATMICAAEEGKDSCQGDSGGPLVNTNGVLVGIVSWGSGCAEEGYPGVYSDVPALKTWIVNNAK